MNNRTQRSIARAIILFVLLLTVAGAREPTAAALETASVPVLDLNGPATGANYLAVFTEDEGPTSIVSPELTLTDADSTTLRSAKISLTNHPDGTAERLDADVSGTNIAKSYNSGTGVLQLSRVDTVANYQQVLRTVTYVNASQAPDTTDRVVTFTVNDGTGDSLGVTSTITIHSLNDAPLLDNTGDMRFADIDEDDTSQVGNSVATVIASAETDGSDRITDPDAGAVEGIAVIEAALANGVWQFSIDAGTSWQPLNDVSNERAVLLAPTARLRFLPNENFNGQTSITFRAWDQTSGTNGQTDVDTMVNGRTTAFSAATETASLNVLAVNDPPVVDLNGPLPDAGYSTTLIGNGGPVNIASPNAVISDTDDTELVSMTVTIAAAPDGADEILTAQPLSSTIAVLPFDATTGSLQLVGNAQLADYVAHLQELRYAHQGSSKTLGERTISFIVNDGTDNSVPVTTTLTVKATNTAPSLVANTDFQLGDVFEDAAAPEGDSVSAIIASADEGAISDPDKDTVVGLALVDADNRNGTWEYSLNNGQSWSDVGAVSTTAATLLADTALLRFLPAADFGDAEATLRVRAWDQSSGVSGSTGVDVSSNGGSTAYSSNLATVRVYVVPVNDPPAISLPADLTAVFIEDEGPVAVTGPSLQLVDVDDTLLQSATVSIVGFNGIEPEMLDATANGSGISVRYNAARGVLLFEGEASASSYQSALRSVSYDNHSDNPQARQRSLRITVSDGADTSDAVTTTVTVEAVNDPPVLDLNSSDRHGTNTFVPFTQDAEAVIVAPELELDDVDNSVLYGARVTLTNRPNGMQERLTVSVSGTQLTQEYDSSRGEIRLSGMDTLANYERVLRGVTYTNTALDPGRKTRVVTFRVEDYEAASRLRSASVLMMPQYAFFPLLGSAPTTSSDEPNNSCNEAFGLNLDQEQQFQAEDVHDWYYFELTAPAAVTVELSQYAPEEGQMLVAGGPCEALVRRGHNGDFAARKVISLGQLAVGRYYIWVITDGPLDTGQPYTLRVNTAP